MLLPNEKLELYGEELLTDEELISIIIGTGIKDRTVYEISKDILKLGEKGASLRFLNDITINDLIKIKGIGKSKAIEIKAISEIAKRINQPVLKYKKITSAKDVFQIFENELKFEKREFVKIIILNNKNIVQKIRNIAIGGTNYSMIEPKQVLSEVVRLEAPKIILVHNHPSGDPTPSFEDYEVTKKINSAASILGIKLLDHVIIGDGIYKSIKL